MAGAAQAAAAAAADQIPTATRIRLILKQGLNRGSPNTALETSSGPLIGIGYRSALASWVESCPAGIDCLEITAGDFYKSGRKRVGSLASRYPLIVRGGRLSLGTPGPIDPQELRRFSSVVATADPLWISEPLGFSLTSEVDLFSPNPVCPNQETLDLLVDHVLQVSDRCGKQLLLENIPSHLRVSGSMAETELFNRLCEKTGCGILLDITSLLVNSRNHGFDPVAWFRDLAPGFIEHLHVAGFSCRDGCWEDDHQNSLQDEVCQLTSEVTLYARPRAVTLEWDGRFPISQIEGDVHILREAVTPSPSVPPA